MKEDKEGGRRRAVENVAGDVVLKGLDAAWRPSLPSTTQIFSTTNIHVLFQVITFLCFS